jgi:hypothetical protein
MKTAAMCRGMATHLCPIGLQMQKANALTMKSASLSLITGQRFQFHAGWNFDI